MMIGRQTGIEGDPRAKTTDTMTDAVDQDGEVHQEEIVLRIETVQTRQVTKKMIAEKVRKRTEINMCRGTHVIM